MTISLNIPDAQANRVINAMAAQYGYQDTLSDGSPNPQTKAQFAKQMIIKFIKAAPITYEANLAVSNYDQVKQAAIDKADSEITIT